MAVGKPPSDVLLRRRGDPENPSWDWPLKGHFCQNERGSKGRTGADTGRLRGILLFCRKLRLFNGFYLLCEVGGKVLC